MFGVATVAILFGIATITTMLCTVAIGYKGTSLALFRTSEKYMHGLAGSVILVIGIGMLYWGW